MVHTKPVIRIQNVVASASVDKKIDLDLIKSTFSEVEYNREQFPGLVFRIKSPKTATLIFTTGKMICAGAKSEKDSINAIRRMLEPKTVTLVFASGKLVCTGARKEPDVYRSVYTIHMLLEEKNLISY